MSNESKGWLERLRENRYHPVLLMLVALVVGGLLFELMLFFLAYAQVPEGMDIAKTAALRGSLGDQIAGTVGVAATLFGSVLGLTLARQALSIAERTQRQEEDLRADEQTRKQIELTERVAASLEESYRVIGRVADAVAALITYGHGYDAKKQLVREELARSDDRIQELDHELSEGRGVNDAALRLLFPEARSEEYGPKQGIERIQAWIESHRHWLQDTLQQVEQDHVSNTATYLKELILALKDLEADTVALGLWLLGIDAAQKTVHERFREITGQNLARLNLRHLGEFRMALERKVQIFELELKMRPSHKLAANRAMGWVQNELVYVSSNREILENTQQTLVYLAEYGMLILSNDLGDGESTVAVGSLQLLSLIQAVPSEQTIQSYVDTELCEVPLEIRQSSLALTGALRRAKILPRELEQVGVRAHEVVEMFIFPDEFILLPGVFDRVAGAIPGDMRAEAWQKSKEIGLDRTKSMDDRLAEIDTYLKSLLPPTEAPTA